MLGAITIASLLFSWRAGWIVTGLAMLSYAFSGWLVLSGTMPITSTSVISGDIGTWISGSTSVLLLAILIVNAIRLTQAEFDNAQKRSQATFRELLDEKSMLERHVSEGTSTINKRTTLLKAVADVGKAITSYRDLSELLQQSVYLIYENFGYYHVGIFLLDEHKEYAVLSATNSEGGFRMLEKKHQLKVGETGIVGYVTQNAEARIALDVGNDAVYFDNPDLPQTRSEIALPLMVGGQILGALDVQSTEPQAFSEEDISTLQILAEQIAVAIQNANLFNEAEKALETSRASYGDVSRDAWRKILSNQPRIGFLATPPTTVQIHSETLEVNLAKAIESGDLIIGSDGLTISMPVRVRGQTIGAIRLKKSAISESWTQDETNLAIALSDQLSGALESARLYKESQQHAARESLISDISARISAISNTETIVRETVQELGQTLGNASVTFQLLDQLDGHKQSKGDSLNASNGHDKRSDLLDNTRKARE
jgi:GAF domain-containing protein